MYYTASISGTHFIQVEGCTVTMITVFDNGRYLRQVIENPVISNAVKSYPGISECSQELFNNQYVAWAHYNKAQGDKQPVELLGDAVPELIEANCMCGRNNLCDECKGCTPDCTCFECIKSMQLIG